MSTSYIFNLEPVGLLHIPRLDNKERPVLVSYNKTIMILDTKGRPMIFEIRYQYQSLFSVKSWYVDTKTSLALVSSLVIRDFWSV